MQYVIGQRIKSAVLHMRTHGTDTKRITVWARAGGAADANVPVGPAHVLDHDRLIDPFSHALGDNARDHVGRAARWEWHYDCDRARRICLRPSYKGPRRRAAEPCDELAPSKANLHLHLPCEAPY
jgi:hypothetical protein